MYKEGISPKLGGNCYRRLILLASAPLLATPASSSPCAGLEESGRLDDDGLPGSVIPISVDGTVAGTAVHSGWQMHSLGAPQPSMVLARVVKWTDGWMKMRMMVVGLYMTWTHYCVHYKVI